MEFHSEAFAGANAVLTDAENSEIASLSESSAVLDLLLQFMYRQRQSELAVVAFEILSELVEAAEKYEVYSAMAMCHVDMRYVCSWSIAKMTRIDRMYSFATVKHTAEVLRYAFKHDYPIIMDEAVPLTVDLSAEHLVDCWAPIPGILDGLGEPIQIS